MSKFYGINSALKIIPANEVAACNLPFRLDTYKGCQHNCSYCYARYVLHSHGQWDADEPKPINPEDFEKKLESSMRERKRKSKVSKLLEKRFPIRLGTNTDCFQPVEREKRVTRKVLEIFDEWEYPYLVNTKSDLASESPYLDLISNASGGAVVQYTIISLDENLISDLEPNSPPVEKRLKSIRKFADKGVATQVRISPIIPRITSKVDDFRDLAEKIKDAGAQDLIVEFLRYTPRMKKWIEDATNNSFDLDKIYSDWGVETKPNGKLKPDSDGYVRVPMKKKFRIYSKYKKIAQELSFNLYVCSEEYPEINDCVNCCGTSKPKIADRFEGFKLHNEAAVNTIACFLREKGEIGLEDIKENFYCVDWDKYENLWEKMDDLLINAEKKTTPQGVRYVYKNRFKF